MPDNYDTSYYNTYLKPLYEGTAATSSTTSSIPGIYKVDKFLLQLVNNETTIIPFNFVTIDTIEITSEKNGITDPRLPMTFP